MADFEFHSSTSTSINQQALNVYSGNGTATTTTLTIPSQVNAGAVVPMTVVVAGTSATGNAIIQYLNGSSWSNTTRSVTISGGTGSVNYPSISGKTTFRVYYQGDGTNAPSYSKSYVVYVYGIKSFTLTPTVTRYTTYTGVSSPYNTPPLYYSLAYDTVETAATQGIQGRTSSTTGVQATEIIFPANAFSVLTSSCSVTKVTITLSPTFSQSSGGALYAWYNQSQYDQQGYAPTAQGNAKSLTWTTKTGSKTIDITTLTDTSFGFSATGTNTIWTYSYGSSQAGGITIWRNTTGTDAQASFAKNTKPLTIYYNKYTLY